MKRFLKIIELFYTYIIISIYCGVAHINNFIRIGPIHATAAKL